MPGFKTLSARSISIMKEQPMSLTIAPVLSSDLEDVHRFQLSVAAQEPIGQLAFPSGASDISVAGYVERSRKCISDPTSILRRVIARDNEDTGGVVGYALWSFVREKQAVIETTDAGGVWSDWPGDVKKEVLEAWIGLRRRKREEVMRGNPHAYLASLLTSTDDGCKGAASELIKWGLSLADAHCLPTFVEASSTNRSLFLEHGFQKAGTLAIDLRPWGGAHVEEYTLLIRPALPLPPSRTILISPWLTNADVVSFLAIEDAAFEEGSALSDIMFGAPPKPDPRTATGSTNDNNPHPPSHPHPPNESDMQFMALRIGDQIDYMATDPTARIVKAFDPTTGQIVAVGHWHFFLSPSTDVHVFPPFRYPPEGNPVLGAHFFGSLLRTQEEHMRDQAYIFMRLLVVLPPYQGKGIGTRLLRWGLEQADHLGVKVWIDASPAGLGLYKKLGWKEVSKLQIELKEWGGREGETDLTVSLVRDPAEERGEGRGEQSRTE